MEKCKMCNCELKASKTGYCRKCYPKSKEGRLKNSNGLKKAYQEGRLNTNHLDGKRGWSKGLTKETDKRIEKQVNSFKEAYKQGKIFSYWKGKNLPIEMREKISQNSKGGCNGFVKTKYYDIFCPYENRTVKVQGTWELKYCQYLNENKIMWIRSRKINLRFKYHENDIMRTYFPDFYLIDFNKYIEIKGYFSDSDKLKMKKVKEYNKDKNIEILEKKDLENFGILL